MYGYKLDSLFFFSLYFVFQIFLQRPPVRCDVAQFLHHFGCRWALFSAIWRYSTCAAYFRQIVRSIRLHVKCTMRFCLWSLADQSRFSHLVSDTNYRPIFLHTFETSLTIWPYERTDHASPSKWRYQVTEWLHRWVASVVFGVSKDDLDAFEEKRLKKKKEEFSASCVDADAN